MMRAFTRLVTPLLALVVVGCGIDPTETPRRPAAERPEPAPVAPPSLAPDAGPAQAMVAKSYAMFRAMRGYQAELNYMQKNAVKKTTGIYEIAGRTPRKLFLHIKEGNNQGVKLLWEGGSKVRVRAGGLLGAVALELPKDDDRFLSVRKYSLDQTDLHSMYAMMTDPSHTVTAAGPDTVLITGPKLLKGCVKMMVKFNPATSLPTQMELSDPKEVVFSIKLKNFRRNDSVSLVL